MDISEKYENILSIMKSEFSDFEIIQKNESLLMKIIDFCLRVITFNQMKLFMKSFTTTIGNKVYVPESWNDYSLKTKIQIMRHERIHMLQAKKYGRILFSFLYLFFPLPLGVSYFRKKFEQEAYEESLKAIYELNGTDVLCSLQLKEQILSHFTSSQYLWMWPFRKDLEKWYDLVLERIKKS